GLSDGAWYARHTQRWHSRRPSPLAPPAGDAGYVGVPLDGGAVIVSGAKAAVYSPAANRWRELPDVPLARVDAPALPTTGAPQRVVVAGVGDNGHPELAWLEAARNAWHTLAMHPGERPAVLLPAGHDPDWYDGCAHPA